MTTPAGDRDRLMAGRRESTHIARIWHAFAATTLWATVSVAAWSSHGHAAPPVAAKDTKITDGSDIGLRMLGTIIQSGTRNSVVLIKLKSGRVEPAKVGFRVAEKYEVIEVHEHFFRVAVVGTRDTILIYQDKFASRFIGSGTPDHGSATTLNTSGDSYSEEGFERKGGQVQMSQIFRDKIIKQDLARVLLQATAEAVLRNGEIVGFQLSQIDKGSIYDKSGLRDGDIITAINGYRLNSVTGAIQLLQSLKNQASFELDYLRGTAADKISISVKD